MTRGKYRRRRHGQRCQALTEEITTLEAAIDREAAALARTRSVVDKTRGARRRLCVETARTTAALGDLETSTARAEAAVASAWRGLREALAELNRVDEALSRPRRGQAASDALAAAVDSGFRLDNTAVARRGAPHGYQELATRRRLGAELPTTRTLDMTGWVPPEAGTAPAQVAPYARAKVTDHSRAALWSYALPPWTGTPTGDDAPELRAELGATASGAPALPDGEFPGRAPSAMSIDKPWRHAPLISQPRDGVDLAHWYHRAAWAQGWIEHDVPMPFWLPGEHATGFPRATALPDELDLRLPFRAVTAMFETPWNLPATRPDDQVAHTRLLFARGRATDPARPLEDHLMRILPVPRAELLSPLELVERLGARVEGLVYRADPDHRPTDEFAWCLALHHPWGLPLGRVVIPASRAATRWRVAVDNMLAGVCLSRWHTPAPAAVLEPASGGDHRPPAAGEVGEVRVLDVDATSPARSRVGSPRATGARRAHLRRGTWRWQWVGPGRAVQRPTWVRDTTVRGTGPLGHQIYRLTHGAAES